MAGRTADSQEQDIVTLTNDFPQDLVAVPRKNAGTTTRMWKSSKWICEEKGDKMKSEPHVAGGSEGRLQVDHPKHLKHEGTRK